MAVAVAEMERIMRRQPDFERLSHMIQTGLVRKRELTGEEVSERQLGERIGYSVALIHGIVKKKNRPDRDVLIALADYFDDRREEWLEAGGFDVESLPRDRGYTTAEREVARWLETLSEGERAELLRKAAVVRSQYDDRLSE